MAVLDGRSSICIMTPSLRYGMSTADAVILTDTYIGMSLLREFLPLIDDERLVCKSTHIWPFDITMPQNATLIKGVTYSKSFAGFSW